MTYNPIVGGSVISLWLPGGSIWTANTYLGLNGIFGSMVTPTTCTPWIAPAPGTISVLTVLGLMKQTSGSVLNVFLCKNAQSTTPTYPRTTLTAQILSAGYYGASPPALSFSVVRGDMIVAVIDGTWTSGVTISALWVPTA